VHAALLTMHATSLTVHAILLTMHATLLTMHATLSTVHAVLLTMHSVIPMVTPGSVHGALYSLIHFLANLQSLLTSPDTPMNEVKINLWPV